MSNDESKAQNQDDLDLFGQDQDERIEEMARHLRTCANCRKLLKEMAKPMAKHVLSTFESDVSRRATTDEKKAIAKSVLIQTSLQIAATTVIAGPIIEAAEQAIREARQKSKVDPRFMQPFNYNTAVGEA